MRWSVTMLHQRVKANSAHLVAGHLHTAHPGSWTRQRSATAAKICPGSPNALDHVLVDLDELVLGDLHLERGRVASVRLEVLLVELDLDLVARGVDRARRVGGRLHGACEGRRASLSLYARAMRRSVRTERRRGERCRAREMRTWTAGRMVFARVVRSIVASSWWPVSKRTLSRRETNPTPHRQLGVDLRHTLPLALEDRWQARMPYKQLTYDLRASPLRPPLPSPLWDPLSSLHLSVVSRHGSHLDGRAIARDVT